MGHKYTHRLGHIHGAAAAQGHDAGGPALPVALHRRIHAAVGGVGHDVQILRVGHAAGLTEPDDPLHRAQPFQAAVRDDQRMAGTALAEQLRQTLQAPHAKEDVLRHLKGKCIHDSSPSPACSARTASLQAEAKYFMSVPTMMYRKPMSRYARACSTVEAKIPAYFPCRAVASRT